ncbi:MAG TPA: NB-ARC domain-containing protein [Promineifilum sp.]|nr:NB-ARC domain-containing protein [Promineifilum sp.]
MNVDDITVSLLNATLRAWRRAEEPPATLLDLDFLRDTTAWAVAPASPAERDIQLRARVTSLAVAELDRLRAAESLPPTDPAATRVALLLALGRDFGGGNMALEEWSALYHRYLAPVSLSVAALAQAAHLDVRNFRHRVNNGARRLAEQLQQLEMAAQQRLRRARLGRHLPPADYTRLFGVAEPQQQLVAALQPANGPDVISIEGLGGIGKTALAREAAFVLAQGSDYDGIAWVSARQTWLNDAGAIETTPDAANTLADVIGRLATQLGFAELAGLSVADKLDRLAPFLRAGRHLIVIDNLESVSDLELLLPALLPLARPTRFLLTSRQTLSHYPLVTRFPVQLLSLADSRALVESELARHGHPARLAAEDMAALHEVVGGMPLALKLVAAQMSLWPLPVLLDNLRRARHRAPEGLYRYIYWRAWQSLGDPARQLLLSLLPLAPDGEDVEWLRLMSFLPPDEFGDALAQLRDASLLEVAGEPTSPRYRLHRLTATFLQTEILAAWGDSSLQESLPNP